MSPEPGIRNLKLDSKIYIAGHRGLVGTALMRNLRARGYTNFLTRTHAELDLTARLPSTLSSRLRTRSRLPGCRQGRRIHATQHPIRPSSSANNLAIQTNIIPRRVQE